MSSKYAEWAVLLGFLHLKRCAVCVEIRGRDCKGPVAVRGESPICKSVMSLWHPSSAQSDGSDVHRLYLVRLPA